eukprot:538923_1
MSKKTVSKWVWNCSTCNSDRRANYDFSREICNKCKEPSYLMLKCRTCKALNVVDMSSNIDLWTEKCVTCQGCFRTSTTAKEVMKRKEKWYHNKLLKACNNFNSMAMNVSLLLYGYINHEIDKDLYTRTPHEIIDMCSAYCYDIGILMEWDSKLYNYWKVGCLHNVDMSLKSDDKKVIVNKIKNPIDGDNVCSLIGVEKLDQRALWNVKITSKCKLITFIIGLGTYYYDSVKNDSKCLNVDNGYVVGTNVSVNNNDVIRILFYENNIKYVLMFGVNEYVKTIEIPRFRFDEVLYLKATLFHEIELQFVDVDA